MFEWMPVLCGAVLGLLHRRTYIGQRTLLCLVVLSGCVATALSGEIFDAPLLVFVDTALVVIGVIAVRVLAPRTRTRGSLHLNVAVGAPHLRDTRARSHTRPRQTPSHHHHDDSL